MIGRVGILVPAYCAEATLGPLLAKLRALHPTLPVLVVDDGSPDATAQVAAAGGAEVLRLPENAGKGSALFQGLTWAARKGWEWAACLDADGQHRPEDLEQFLALDPDPDLAVVVGARRLAPPEMPWPRVASNRLTTWLLSLQARQPLWDSQCGYRLVRLSAFLRSGLPERGRFEWESEALVRLARKAGRVGRVRIATVYEDAGSHIRPWRDTWRFVRLWWRLWAEIARGRI